MMKKSLSAGYALFLSVALLSAISLLCLSALTFSRTREVSALAKEKRFYADLNEKNEALLSEWRNEHENN